MARRHKLIKHLVFDESNIDDIERDALARVNLDVRALTLAEDAAGFYSINPDISAKTLLTRPKAVRAWLGFEADDVHFLNEYNQQVTSLGYRLSDGVDEYWWNGSGWETNMANWNTEAEVADNIASFSAVARALEVVVNLVTTDRRYTPRLRRIKILYEVQLDSYQEDIVYRSLIPAMKGAIRPIADHPIDIVAATATIALASFPTDTPYTIVGVDAVYDHTADPDHQADLFQSYDPATKVITLSQQIQAKRKAWIRVVYQPDVIVNRSRDDINVSKVPALVLSDINLVKASDRGGVDSVANRAAGTAWELPAPKQGDLEIQLYGATSKGVDHMRLADEVKRFFDNAPLLTSTGLDEQYRLWLIDEYDMAASGQEGEIHIWRARFRVAGVCYWTREAKQVTVVSKFSMRLSGETNPLNVA